jgi:hypothetical protein
MAQKIKYHIMPLLFWGPALGCIAAYLGLLFRPLRTWASWAGLLGLIGAWLVGLVAGLAAAVVVGNKFPSTWARHDRAAGMGDYWGLGDFIMTYLILGVVTAIGMVVISLVHNWH